MPANLTPRNGSNPAQGEVNSHGHDADDPKHLAVILAVVTENNGEDDAAEIARRAGNTGDDSCVDRISKNLI